MKKTIISTTLASIFFTPCFVFAASENDIPSYSNSINVVTGVEEQQFLKGYNTFLQAMRESRDSVKSNRDNANLVKEIKQRIKQDQGWSIETRQKYAILRDKVHQDFYDSYSGTKPQGLEELTVGEATNMFTQLREINRNDPKLEINIQGFSDRSISEISAAFFVSQAISARFVPTSFYQDTLNESLFTSRITLNFTKKYLPQVTEAFSKLFTGELEGIVRQAKVMAPSKFAALTDQAVLYLEGAEIDNAQKVLNFLNQYIPEEAWIEHQPLGMVTLAKGRNYSESSRLAFSSHGGSRATVATSAILDNLIENESLAILLPEQLEQHGYQKGKIALVDKAFDYRSEFVRSLEAAHELASSPQQFLKKYTLDVTPLLTEKGPSKGKPVISGGTDGYQLNIQREQGRASKDLRVLRSPILDNAPTYVDIKKSADLGQMIVSATTEGGTIVVVDHSQSRYRVYFDKRPHAYVLYDNVVAMRDLSSGYRVEDSVKFDHGMDVTFLVYTELGWQSVVQKQSFNSFSDLEVRRTASTTAVPVMLNGENLSPIFEQSRSDTQNQLKKLAQRLGISTDNIEDLPYDPVEVKSVDTHSSLSQWNELRAKIKQKLTAQRKSLARQRLVELGKVKTPGYPNKEQAHEKLALLRKSLVELDNNAFGLVNLSRDIDVMWLNYQQKLEQGIDQLIITDDSLRTGNVNKNQIHQRFLAAERDFGNLIGSKKIEFDDGYEHYQEVEIPGFEKLMSITQKQLILLGDNGLNARQKGALTKYINVHMDSEKTAKVLDYTSKFNREMSRIGGRVVASIPQDFVLALLGDGSGRCYPLVRAMSVASARGEQAIRNFSDKLFIGAANPQAVESQLLLDGLQNLHTNSDARESSYLFGRLYIDGIIKAVKRELAAHGKVSFALNTASHSMGLYAINDMGTKRYYFYDPNFSIVEFSSLKSLKKSLESHLIVANMAEFYSADRTLGRPELSVVSIDTSAMADIEILPGQQVVNLTTDEPLALIEDDESIIVLEQSEEQSRQDLSLRASLTKVSADKHARILSKTIASIVAEHQLPPEWIPIVASIEEVSSVRSAITFVSPDGIEEKRVEVAGTELVKVRDYLSEQFSSMKTSHNVASGERLNAFQFEDAEGVDGLNAAFAVQSIITWFQEKQRNQVSDPASESLRRALEIHSYVMAAQITHGVLNDAQHMVNLFKTAMTADTEVVSTTLSGIAGLANQGIGIAFGAVNIGLNSYELANAQNTQQEAVFATQLGFNTVGTALGGAAIGAGLVGASTTAVVLGEAGAIVGGLAVGFTALAEAFGKIALDAEQVGRYFHSVDQAYKKGGYRYDIENDILLPIPGAVIEKIDLSQGVIEIGSQKLYSSKHGKTGSGYLNYFFWAGDLPHAQNDKSKAISIRERLGYSGSHSIETDSSNIMLPATGESFIDYDYQILPGSTTRQDLGFDVLRKLETQGDFDFDFYVFPSEFIIRTMKEEFVDHTVEIDLGTQNRTIYTPKVGGFGVRKLSYHLISQGGSHELFVQPQAHYQVSDVHSTIWNIDAREVNVDKPRLQEDILVLGETKIDFSLSTSRESNIFLSNGEVWHLNDSGLSLVETEYNPSEHAEGIQHHLQQMVKDHQILGNYVVVDNFEHAGELVGRAYYDVTKDRFIATNDVSIELTQHAELIDVQTQTALFFNKQYGQLWRTELSTGKLVAFYPVHKPVIQAISADFDAWIEAGSILVGASYKMPDQSTIRYLYRLTENGLMLTDIHGDRELFEAVSSQSINQASQLSPSYLAWMDVPLVDLPNDKRGRPQIADIIEIGMQRYTPVWLVKGKSHPLSISFERPIEDLKLILVDDETQYFYSKNEHELYIQHQNSIKRVALQKDEQISAHDHVYVVRSNGEINLVMEDGHLSLVGLNKTWLQHFSNSWQSEVVSKLKGTKHQIMLYGLTDYNGTPLTVWYLPDAEKFILLSTKWGSDKYKLVGSKDENTAWLFNVTSGNLATLQMFDIEQMYSFTPDFKFITDGLLQRPLVDTTFDQPLKNFSPSHDGFKAETLSGLVFNLGQSSTPVLTAVLDRWLENNHQDINGLLDRYATQKVVQFGETDQRWIVVETGQVLSFDFQDNMIWIGESSQGFEQIFYRPRSKQLFISGANGNIITALGYYEDVARTKGVLTLISDELLSQDLNFSGIKDTDSLVLSSFGRENNYNFNNLIGEYLKIIVDEGSYSSVIDLSTFSSEQIVVQHSGDELTFVVDGKTSIVITDIDSASKKKMSVKISDKPSAIKILFIQEELDRLSIDGVFKISHLSI
mgnify:CR=1 FL=1